MLTALAQAKQKVINKAVLGKHSASQHSRPHNSTKRYLTFFSNKLIKTDRREKNTRREKEKLQ